ncbi:NADH:ubiquinone oxidoreductase 17.2 kD subunit-like protein [Nitzschia inconspicua]|uniref:NADH dehydrogenase [ubiquinone] 1 alpha subcomplex subunit 12 n=1 Tax=Nitzschia inconspicua TaxID=303405 RepID=A0A9K3PVN3_9STRA|nr:NADH:ubiquinone oxidoreductase 17.2 kD subunit-like protein [Nitzschia inconspicua]
MPWGLIENFRTALQYRGGWKGLLQHMYSNGDFPFKIGTYMGCDAFGNRYYENRVDYPTGQHRWVEPADIQNFDSSQIPPEWHGWMTSMNDVTPSQEDEYFEKMTKRINPSAPSDAPYKHNIGYQNELFHFNGMHNQSQIRSRGYGIGNSIVGLPPFAPDAYYTQPGSPYNPAFIRKFEYEGDLDEAKGGGRPYKNDLWKERLMTAAEKEAKVNPPNGVDFVESGTKLTPREEAILARGGTIPGK